MKKNLRILPVYLFTAKSKFIYRNILLGKKIIYGREGMYEQRRDDKYYRHYSWARDHGRGQKK